MNLNEITEIRLKNQQIGVHNFDNPKDLVAWMGAMQAQDLNMVKWAIGLRLSGLTEKSVEIAIDKGEIIRTHLLRPTWHIVPAEDVYWMLELTAPRIKSSMRSRHKQLEITPAVLKKSRTVIERILSADNHASREELVTGFDKAGLINKDNRAAHLLMLAELDGMICSGITRNNLHTYALLEERAPKVRYLSRDESLAELGRRYFTSHGPATADDFVWWSGLAVTDVKRALEMIKSEFNAETINSRTYWFRNPGSGLQPEHDSIHLLPAYDELIIGYRNRKAIIAEELHKKAISSNGMFWPVILLNNRVAGVWKRKIIKDNVMIKTEFFNSSLKENKRLIEEKVSMYGSFLEKKIKII